MTQDKRDFAKWVAPLAALIAAVGGIVIGLADDPPPPAVIIIRGSTLLDDGLTDSERDREHDWSTTTTTWIPFDNLG